MLYSRDLIKVLKWHVDRITEVERQAHNQEVLKVTQFVRGMCNLACISLYQHEFMPAEVTETWN